MTLGQWGERVAQLHVQQHGFELLVANYHARYGEIDLIIQKESLLVFVEVKVRSSTRYGAACEVVSPSKQQKIIQTAMVFLQENEQYHNYDLRFDVISIQMKQHVAKIIQQDFSSLTYDLAWIEHAFML